LGIVLIIYPEGKKMIAYYNGAFLPKDKISISPDDRGFLFGDGAYDVIRAYDGKLFELPAHLDRFEQSIKALRIEYPEIRDLEQFSVELIKETNLAKVMLMFIFRLPVELLKNEPIVFPITRPKPPSMDLYALFRQKQKR
jgi:branched-subunit amino acid aminotransferase/4-amino-4-deoxychorismate lyase